jgi:hypothetical protein
MARTEQAVGTFEVKMAPLPADASPAALGRMSIDKRFSGDLEATSQGIMLSAGAPHLGAAGYVAMEIVSGSLRGRNGTFALQHSGTIAAGVPQLKVIVAPGSATGDLAGLAGELTIRIADGKHAYELDYTLGDGAA